MSYNAAIPQPGDELDVSQGDLLQNFQTIQTWGDQNHYSFADLTTNRGKHKNIQTPVQSPMPATAANEPSLFGYQFSVNSGVIQVSRGPSNAVPTPVTSLQSPATPIALTPGQETTVLDFTGLTMAIATLYVIDANVAGSTNKGIFYIVWSNAAFTIQTVVTSQIGAISSGSELKLINNTGATNYNNVFWTLDFERIV